MDNFEFITDQIFNSLLNRDYQELEKCMEIGASKAVLILSGSIVEAVLIEFFIHNKTLDKTKNQILKMGLTELIDEAVKIELISNTSKELATVIKNYRNLIHPGREIRKNEKFDIETANVSFSLVKIILNEIKDNYNQKYGYKAEDIFQKITIDMSTHSIYEDLLKKLNEHEKKRLMDILVKHHVENFEKEKQQIWTYYIFKLKPLIDVENLLHYCKDLYRQVEKGKESQILALFEIFGYDLDILNKEEQELILTYIYSIADSMTFLDPRIKIYKSREIFAFFGYYLESSKLKEKFFNLLLTVVKNHSFAEKDYKKSFIYAYNNMTRDLTEDKIEKCVIYIKENVSEDMFTGFFNAINEDEDLPF